MKDSAQKYCCLGLLVIISILLSSFQSVNQDPHPNDDFNIHITQIDTSQFPKVSVFASATDALGEPIAVNPAGIQLKENDQPIILDQVIGLGETSPLTTMLVIDNSGSMNSGGKLAAAKSAAQSYIQQMRPGDQAGLLTFNTSIVLVHAPSSDHQSLIASIQTLTAKNDTIMYDAIARAVELLEPIVGRKAIIVLTDGLDNRSTTSIAEVVAKIGPVGLSISTIGLGDPAHGKGAQTALDEAALSSIANKTGGVYGYASNNEDLHNLYERYGRALKAEYQLTYTSPSSVRDGVNRALSISIDSKVSKMGSINYNPGGLVPEIGEPAPWWLFTLLMASLLFLLILPIIMPSMVSWIRQTRKNKPPDLPAKPFIKLLD